LRLEWISSAEAQKFVKVVSEFTEEIRALGPNPVGRYTCESGKKIGRRAACPTAPDPVLADTAPGPHTVPRAAAEGR